MAQLNANLSDYNVSRILAPGWYPATVVNSEIKAGPKGAYIKWTFQADENKAYIYDIHTMGHEVGLRKLKTLATHSGHKNPNYIADTEELHGRRVEIKVKIEKSEEYEDKNTVTDYRPIGSAPGLAAGVAAGISPALVKPPIPTASCAPPAPPVMDFQDKVLPEYQAPAAAAEVPPHIAEAAIAQGGNGNGTEKPKMPWEK